MVQYIFGDAEDLPLPDGCADVAGCATSVRFFGRSQRAAAELRRVVRPGGTVVLSELGAADRKWLLLADLLRRAVRRAPTVRGFAALDLHQVLRTVTVRR